MAFLLKRVLIISMFLNAFISEAQDPHFTQFYNSPLTVNPTLAGVFNTGNEQTKIRFLSNFRNQWVGSQSQYKTGTLQMDMKLGSQSNDEVQQNPFNLGFLCMYDQSLNGAFKSNYFMGSASLHLPIGGYDNEGAGYLNYLGMGFGIAYGDRSLNLSQISFSQQFTSGGFDVLLPSGENGLRNMKSFLSLNAGILFQSKFGYLNSKTVKLGIAGYHLNKPKQTFLNDPLQVIPLRYTAQIEYSKKYENYSVLEMKVLYQRQATINYLLAGFIYNINLPGKLGGDDYENTIGAGVFYRINDALSPYLCLAFGPLRFGCSYDITTSNLKNGLLPSRSFEFSLQYILYK